MLNFSIMVNCDEAADDDTEDYNQNTIAAEGGKGGQGTGEQGSAGEGEGGRK